MENISLFLAHLDEATTVEHMRMHNFLLCLNGTAIVVVFFFITLLYWFLDKSRRKFHEHFYNRTNENLTWVKKGRDESILDYANW